MQKRYTIQIDLCKRVHLHELIKKKAENSSSRMAPLEQWQNCLRTLSSLEATLAQGMSYPIDFCNQMLEALKTKGSGCWTLRYLPDGSVEMEYISLLSRAKHSRILSARVQSGTKLTQMRGRPILGEISNSTAMASC